MNDLSGKEDTFNAHKTAHSLATFRIYACMITPRRQAPVSAALDMTRLVLANLCGRKGLAWQRVVASPDRSSGAGGDQQASDPARPTQKNPRVTLHSTRRKRTGGSRVEVLWKGEVAAQVKWNGWR